MWPEVELARKEKRHELVLTGSPVSQRISKDGLDTSLFNIVTINYLNISETNLDVLPDDISKLENLQTLVLHSNKLKVVNPKIAQLAKLKILDLSRNFLTSFPEEFAETVSLVTLMLQGNEIERFPALTKSSKMTALDLSNNKLTAFPDVCHKELCNLAELKLKGNAIESIPSSISQLPALKLLELNSNKIKTVPGELVDCAKLKDLNLKDNPISDRRLFKLIDQCRTIKQVTDYIKQHCPKTAAQEKGQEKSKTRNYNNVIASSDEEEEVESKYKIEVTQSKDDFTVTVLDNVVNNRGYFVGCVVHDVKFDDRLFRRFIQIQNKLHETLCNKRNNATIATHDFKKIPPGNLTYTTMLPNELKITPLNQTKEITGAELFNKLQTEANALRKEKKRATYSGIHKYLNLIENKTEYPCLLNCNNEVISFPPLTNSDISKIQMETTSIFIEVTSSVSIHQCKSVMNALIKDMVLLFEKDVVKIQQIRTVDKEGKLKVAYPSKTDLEFDESLGIKVVRT